MGTFDHVPRQLVPPYLRVAAELREKIINGELLPGEQVPSLDRLAETYSISRTTARRAVQVLMTEGLVESRPRWGVFVTEPR
jgi:DNA-binding GntR family transcriptional regulator